MQLCSGQDQSGSPTKTRSILFPCVKRQSHSTAWPPTRLLTTDLCSSTATPNASPSTATPPTASASPTSPTGPSGTSTTTTAKEWGKQVRQELRRRRQHAEDIFAYTYAMLHDPDYRHEYAIRPAARVPQDSALSRLPRMGDRWAANCFDLHIGFESAEPFPISNAATAPLSGDNAPKPHPEAPTSRRA